MTEPATLAELRTEIDRIDDALHDLLIQRAAIVAEVRVRKPPGGIAFRPAREAAIMRRLLRRHHGPQPVTAIIQLWHELIGASSTQQGQGQILAGAEVVRVAQRHFGWSSRVLPLPTAKVLEQLREGGARLGVLGWPGTGPDGTWWLELAKNPRLPRVVAAIPFLRDGGDPQAVVLADIVAEATEDDRTWLAVPGGAASPQDAIFIAEGQGWRLVEVPGFPNQDADGLGKADRVVLIGAFATPASSGAISPA